MPCTYTPLENSILTADGCMPVGVLPVSGCCPPDPCHISMCCTLMGHFVNLLPNGPLWDGPKIEALQRIGEDGCDESACMSCGSLVAYAMYTGRQLYDLIQSALIPALRNDSPLTASEDVLDTLLAEYDWRLCYECRQGGDGRLGPILPIEIDNECGGMTYAPVAMPEGLECAIKRATLLALTRLDMSPIKNLCGINWVIEPLGAVLTPYNPSDELACCRGQRFEICPISDYIEACSDYCVAPTQIQAWFPHPVSEIAVWPGIYAAQCIALSMLPDIKCVEDHVIVRCPSHVPPLEVVP